MTYLEIQYKALPVINKHRKNFTFYHNYSTIPTRESRWVKNALHSGYYRLVWVPFTERYGLSCYICIDKPEAHICALLFRQVLPLHVWCARLWPHAEEVRLRLLSQLMRTTWQLTSRLCNTILTVTVARRQLCKLDRRMCLVYLKIQLSC